MKFVERSQIQREVLKILNENLGNKSQLVGFGELVIRKWLNENAVQSNMSNLILNEMPLLFSEMVYGGIVIRPAPMTLAQFEEKFYKLLEIQNKKLS